MHGAPQSPPPPPPPSLLPKTIRPLYWGLHFLWGEGCEGARFCEYILLDLLRKGQSTICYEPLFWSKTTPVNHFFYECILWYFAPITCWRAMKMLFTIYWNTSQQQILKFFANRTITFLIWVLFPERLDKFKWFEVFNGCIIDPWILLFRLQKILRIFCLHHKTFWLNINLLPSAPVRAVGL